jgi:2-phospho-L-lactate guanylyltransferase
MTDPSPTDSAATDSAATDSAVTDSAAHTLWTVVIPVKGTPLAKSRLAVAEPNRGALALAFALDTVAAALAADRVQTVLVVTGSDTVEHRMRGLGAVTVRETSAAGLNPAIDEALTRARALLPEAPIAVLLGDLPALDPAELDVALDRAREYPRAMVADAAGVGTVLVTALRGIPHRLRFGGASRAAHLDAGYIELEMDAGLGLRQDVDTLDDLLAANETTLGAATRALRAESALRSEPDTVP